MTSLPQEFMNPVNIITFTGSTFAITIICSVFRRLWGVSNPMLPATLALILCFGFAYDEGFPHNFVGWLVLIVNACMLFCAAVGANETASNFVNPPTVGKDQQFGGGKRDWFSSFF